MSDANAERGTGPAEGDSPDLNAATQADRGERVMFFSQLLCHSCDG